MTYDEISIGQTAALTRRVTRETAEAYISLTGDNNPLHVGSRGVVHGALLTGYVSALIGTLLPGAGAVWLIHKMTHIRSVIVGNEIIVEARVTKKFNENQHVKLEVDITSCGQLCAVCVCYVKAMKHV